MSLWEEQISLKQKLTFMEVEEHMVGVFTTKSNRFSALPWLDIEDKSIPHFFSIA